MDITQRMEDVKARKRRQELAVSQSLEVVADNRSFQQIEDDKRDRCTEKEQLQRKKESLVEEENRVTKKFQSLKLIVSEAEKAFLTAKGVDKRHTELEGRISQISVRENEIRDNMSKINREVTIAERELATSERALDIDREKQKKEEAHVQAKILSLRGELDVLKRAINSTEDSCKNMSNRTSSSMIKKELDSISLSITEKDEVLREYQPQINVISSKIAHEEQVKKVVSDNISYRTIRKELDEKQSEYEVKRAAALKIDEATSGSRKPGVNSDGIGAIGAAYISEKKREVMRAEQEHQRFSDTRANLSGRLSALREQTDEYELKLNASQFKSIDERCRKKNIEFETTQMACTDLEAYLHALDRALLNFHTLKIKEVNKIIKELWQLIYRGEDIDNIEIVSGIEAAESGVSSGGRGDKSFNYRVVMKKGKILESVT